MDMGGMSASSSMDMMMKMYFHGGYNEVILFDFWRINSIGGLIGSMVGCFLLAIFYEGLKFYREYLFRTSFQPTARSSLPGGDGGMETEVLELNTECVMSNSIFSVYGESGSLNNHRSSSSSSSVTHPRGVQHLDTDQMSIKMVETSIWSKGHFYLTLLHFVQVRN